MPRSAVAVCLPRDEFLAVEAELLEAGYESVRFSNVDELEALLGRRRDIGLAIMDGEADFDATIEMYGVLHEGSNNVSSLWIVAPQAIDQLSLPGRATANAEFITRPYSAASMRWRVEAMLIRAETLLVREENFGAEQGTNMDGEIGIESVGGRRGRIVVVFNPKGGVGKTTITVNTAAVLQLRKKQSVLLVDCDTVTGHVLGSMGMGKRPSVVDVWTADMSSGRLHSLAEMATVHSSGVSVVSLASSPLHTEVLEPTRVARAIAAARVTYDWVMLDMHPDYGPLNQVIFAMADMILVPVTPDVPTMRAAVQLRVMATDLRLNDRMAIVVNRAKSGVSSDDVERVVGLGTIARVRSAGMVFVQAANAGRSAVEAFPNAKVIDDIEVLADRLVAARDAATRVETGRGGSGFLRSVRSLLGRFSSQSSAPNP